MKPNLPWRLAFTLCAFALVSLSPAFGQGAIDQSTVGADRELDDATRQQESDLIKQKNTYQLEVNQTEKKDDNYRNYAQTRIQALLKLKNAGGSPSKSLTKDKQGELYALEHWLNQDTENKEIEQRRIQQLDQSIASLQQSQTAAIQDMRSDIHNMRVDADAQTADKKFQQQMSVNYFNELQSEMGAASWGRPPEDGTYNTMGGSMSRLLRGGGSGGYGGYAQGGYNY